MSNELYLGYDSLEEAVDSTPYTSQPEALARMMCGESVFLSGVSGAGKSFVVNKFVEVMQEHFLSEGVPPEKISKAIVVTGSTGLASANIGGVTIHSFTGLYRCDKPIDKKKVRDKEYRKEMNMSPNFYGANGNMKNAEVVIVDEVSMLDSVFIDNMDTLLKVAKKNNEPFGGVVMVFVGDFMQLPPVSKSRNDEVGFAFESQAWKDLDPKLLFLGKPKRSADARLNTILGDMREQRVSKESKDYLKMCKSNDVKDSYVRLYTTNKNVNNYNEERLKQLPGEEKVFTPRLDYRFETLDKNKSPNYNLILKNEERVKDNAVKTLGEHKGVVKLKVGAVVVITSNSTVVTTDSREEMVVNGDSGVVERFIGETVQVRLNRNGKSVYIAPRETSVPLGAPYKDPNLSGLKTVKDKNGNLKKDYSDVPIFRDSIVVRHLPLKLSFAITVHKSQGQTLHGVVVDLTRCFSPGLGYVAMSRVASLDTLVITKIGKSAFWSNPECADMSKSIEEKARENRDSFKEEINEYGQFLDAPMLINIFWDVENLLEQSFF